MYSCFRSPHVFYYAVKKDLYGTVVLTLGFANPEGFRGRLPGIFGWLLSFHVLLFFNILY